LFFPKKNSKKQRFPKTNNFSKKKKKIIFLQKEQAVISGEKQNCAPPDCVFLKMDSFYCADFPLPRHSKHIS
jgi:hypothetical protein